MCGGVEHMGRCPNLWEPPNIWRAPWIPISNADTPTSNRCTGEDWGHTGGVSTHGVVQMYRGVQTYGA